MTGSPPLTRVLLKICYKFFAYKRITPAHAGTTVIQNKFYYLKEDHPRSRGYYASGSYPATLSLGSPPLTRVLQHGFLANLALAGITPAHAGTTKENYSTIIEVGDHPRSRGYYASNLVILLPPLGSPPLTRVLHRQNTTFQTLKRITPAHAGTTLSFLEYLSSL